MRAPRRRRQLVGLILDEPWITDARLRRTLLNQFTDLPPQLGAAIHVHWSSSDVPNHPRNLSALRTVVRALAEDDRRVLLVEAGGLGWLAVAWGAWRFSAGLSQASWRRSTEVVRRAKGQPATRVPRFFEVDLLHHVRQTTHQRLVREPSYTACRCSFCAQLNPTTTNSWDHNLAEQHGLDALAAVTERVVAPRLVDRHARVRAAAMKSGSSRAPHHRCEAAAAKPVISLSQRNDADTRRTVTAQRDARRQGRYRGREHQRRVLQRGDASPRVTTTRMRAFAHLKLTDLPARHRLAMAAGAGVVLTPEDERLSGPDELVALALPPLVRLCAVALLVDADLSRGVAVDGALAREAAAVLLLIDCALTAHGRQHDYLTGAWRERAFDFAHAIICCARDDDSAGSYPTGRLVDDVAEVLSSVVLVLHRDRLGVPEALTDALGALAIHLTATAN